MWCGARNGRSVASRPLPMPAALWYLRDLRASSKLGGGRSPAARRASMVLPGQAARSSTVVAAGRGYLVARLVSLLPADVGKVRSPASARQDRRQPDGGSGDQRPWSRSASRASRRNRAHPHSPTSAGLAGVRGAERAGGG